MIKSIKLFVNNNLESIEKAAIVKNKLNENGFRVVDDDQFSLAIAIGGDGSFLRAVKQNNYNSNIYYVGINTGHLGFLQDINPDDIDKFIEELKEKRYTVDKIGIQETKVNLQDKQLNYYSLNEILIRAAGVDLFRANVYIDDEYLESFSGDGIMIATSTGSTAHNLGFGGAIVYPNFATLQITSMAPINSRRSRSMINSIIVPDKKVIKVTPDIDDVLLTVDGINEEFSNVNSIESTINNKKIKCLRFSHYSFPKKINEKLL